MVFMLLAVPASAAFLALLPAVFLLGWVIRLADRLTVPVPAFAAGPGTSAPAQVMDDGTGAPGRPARLLAPRCAALCSMAMGITMGYMLITML
jgi:hypothetical protein